jgi:transcription initiation factor TFIIIB Brf1 subunit/transcription initiation factor TFIIB
MGYPTKIATCCYCGSRAALVLDQSRHELSCASCGAPLHNMKKFPQERSTDWQPHRPKRTRPLPQTQRKPTGHVRKKGWTRRKSIFRHVLEEAFDVIEDIFD